MPLPMEELHLSRPGAEAWLAPARGGLLTRFSVGGEEVLFLDEATLVDSTKNVRGGVPILFPIAGKLAPDMLLGALAPLKQHGFARNLPWRVVEVAGDRAVLTLSANEATRAAFPHDFLLTYTYTLGERRLDIEQRFANAGKAPMRIQPGLHPYFRVDDKVGVRVATDATTAWDNVAGKRVPFSAASLDLSEGEVDLHLLDHGSTGTTLTRPGATSVRLEWSADQKLLVLWTLPGRPFVCVEPWSAPANALHEGGGLALPPGGVHTSTLAIIV